MTEFNPYSRSSTQKLHLALLVAHKHLCEAKRHLNSGLYLNTMSVYNHRRRLLKEAVYALHWNLFLRGRTKVRPPLLYRTAYNPPPHLLTLKVTYQITAKEAEDELRSLGIGRNQARRLIRDVKSIYPQRIKQFAVGHVTFGSAW